MEYLRPNINVRGDEGESMGSTVQDMMFDMANNVSILRKMRGECKVRNGKCQEHGVEAKRVTQTKLIWTRNVTSLS